MSDNIVNLDKIDTIKIYVDELGKDDKEKITDERTIRVTVFVNGMLRRKVFVEADYKNGNIDWIDAEGWVS